LGQTINGSYYLLEEVEAPSRRSKIPGSLFKSNASDPRGRSLSAVAVKDGKRTNAGTFRIDFNGEGVITYHIDDPELTFDAIGSPWSPIHMETSLVDKR
jgi:hypothetical protein